VNYEFIIWELWENISLCFFLGGGGGTNGKQSIAKRSRTKKQQQSTNISYHSFLILTIVVGLSFAISGRRAIRP
jgi:hypothetical protein